LLVAGWAPYQAEGDKILFVFDVGELDAHQTDQIALPADELSAWSFHDEDGLGTALIPRLARRVVEAIDAKRSKGTKYLEHGAAAAG
jgi:8-oxo-dGTP diphosphatase